ncbi:MAG: serine protein kinase RIO [Desulfurococcales archaeon]|nr:serine protein kinase RIO [Desulfurococcales archaeon]
MRRRARWLRRAREEDERVKDRDLLKTVEEVFDPITMGHVERLIAKGVIRELRGVVSAGKEARVYWARGRGGRELAVKIYLSFTAEFRKSIRKYILGDPRFERIPSGNFRRLIYEWTRKEFRNLRRLREAGVRVPEPLAFQGNVLVMEFLGEEGYRAPLLVEAAREAAGGEILELWRDTVEQLRGIVCRARLVHADLSEYNLIVWRGGVWVIDVAQAVSHGHPHAAEFLERDIRNIASFYRGLLGAEPPGLGELRGELLECLKGSR